MVEPHAYRSEAARARAFASYDALLARWPLPPREQRVKTRFGETHVVSAGAADAPPLVLLHGASSNASHWLPNVGALAGAWQLVAPDLPGDAGKSERGRLRGPDDAVAWLAELLDALGLSRVRLGGHSRGGWIALRFALAHPERVERLVLSAPASLRPLRPAFVARSLLGMLRPSRSRLERYHAYLASPRGPGPPAWILDDAWERLSGWRLEVPSMPALSAAELARLAPPTLVAVGEDEVLYDPRRALAWATRAVPGIRTALVPETGHLLPVERPKALNPLWADFLAEA